MTACVARGDATMAGKVAAGCDAYGVHRAADPAAFHLESKSPPDGGLSGFRPDQVRMEDGGLAVMALSFSRLIKTGFS